GNTKTWTGGGSDNNWTTAANWSPSGVVPGDTLLFPTPTAARPSNNNDFTANTFFNAITFEGSGYTLAGNSVRVLVGVTDSAPSGGNTMSFPLNVTVNKTFDVTNPAETLTAAGVISGGGGFTKTGAGILAVTAANTYTGATTINAGAVNVQSNAGFGDPAGATTVASGATVQVEGVGLSVAEPLTANGGSL